MFRSLLLGRRESRANRVNDVLPENIRVCKGPEQTPVW